MAKIVIAGDAVVITSSMRFADIQTIQKYRPEELVLKGGEDGKEPIFAIGITNGCGNINEVGASFGRASHGDEKFATITMVTENVTGDVKEWVADRIGGAVINLNKLEEKLPTILAEIEGQKAEIMNNITVAQ